MSENQNQFAENAKFPFRKLQNAITALMNAPRDYYVSMPINIDTNDLAINIARQSQLEGYLRIYSDFVDAPRWQEELDALKPQNEKTIEEINTDIQERAKIFYEEVRSYGYETNKGDTSSVNAFHSNLYGADNTSANILVKDVKPDVKLVEKYKIKEHEPKFDSIKPDYRRLLTLGLAEFVKQLGATLHQKSSLWAPEYIKEIHEPNHYPGPLGWVEFTPNDFRKKHARVQANNNARDAFENLRELQIFQYYPEVRATLIAEAFWNGNKDALKFLDTLDFMVESGFVKKVGKENSHRNALYHMYNNFIPHATLNDRHDCERNFQYEADVVREVWSQTLMLECETTEFKRAMDHLKDKPDFADEYAKRQKEYSRQQMLVTSKTATHKHLMDFVAPNHQASAVQKLTSKVQKIIDDHQLNIDMESDVTISSSGISNTGEYTIYLKMHATEDELKTFRGNGILIDNYNSATDEDKFDIGTFIKCVNNPSKLKEDQSVVGITSEMQDYLSTRPSLKQVRKRGDKPQGKLILTKKEFNPILLS